MLTVTEPGTNLALITAQPQQWQKRKPTLSTCRCPGRLPRWAALIARQPEEPRLSLRPLRGTWDGGCTCSSTADFSHPDGKMKS